MGIGIQRDEVRPYGTWPSVITAEEIVRDAVRLGMVQADGDTVYWTEGRPADQGRTVLVRCGPDGRRHDVTPAGFSVRTRAHEYGGGDFRVHNGIVWFANDRDQRLYRQAPDDAPLPVTPEGDRRYADLVVDAPRDRLICVVEDGAGDNWLAAVPCAGGPPVRLVSGNDFYANPVISPDGTTLAWLTWNHPNLPWDGTELWQAPFAADGTLEVPVRIAGGPAESVFQPQWSAEGTLHFVSDRSGWWNLYAWRDGRAECVLGGEREMGLPQWVFGMSTYALLGEGRAAVAVNEQGIWRLVVTEAAGREERLRVPWTDIASLQALPGGLAFIAGSPRHPPCVVRYEFADGRDRILRRASDLALDPEWISLPQHVVFPTADGGPAHAFYYPPTHPDCVPPPGEAPPLIVETHGGPTAAASTTLDARTQFWTSRGFAVLDVNYRGSTGYGRAYRDKLVGAWGVADVEDCIAGARFLVEQGRADKDRLIITGGSAGGYTTLAALTFHDVFRAGASYYGISDLEALVRDTHKFESRYLDRLVGPYPEAIAVYRERSPIHHAAKLSCPVIFFQGSDDKVVPPNQASAMVEALRTRHAPVAFLLFAGEGHGFRQADNIRRALDSELYFYGRVFGFDPADPLDPVDIHA